MTKNLLIFIAAFIGGTVIALAVRTALHDPHASHAAQSGTTVPAPMVDNTPPPGPPQPAPAAPHAGHGQTEDGKPVNTICPICGMEVDPSVATATYQGKVVGFGCRACPPRFAKEPDRYGPAALQNVVAED